MSAVVLLELHCDRAAPNRSPSLLKFNFSLCPRIREIQCYDMTVDQLLGCLPVNLVALRVISPTADGVGLDAPSFKALARQLEDESWLPNLRNLYIHMLHFSLWERVDGQTPPANTIWNDFMRIEQAAKDRGNLVFLLC